MIPSVSIIFQRGFMGYSESVVILYKFFFFAFLGYVCEVGGWVQALDSHRIAWTLYLTLGSLGIANAKSCNLWSQDTLPFSVSLSLFVNNYCVYIAHLLYLSINLSQGHSTFFPIGYLLLFFPTCSLLSSPPQLPTMFSFLSLKFPVLSFTCELQSYSEEKQ